MAEFNVRVDVYQSWCVSELMCVRVDECVRGSPLVVVMIHEWIAAGTCSYNYGSTYAQHLLHDDDIMFVSQVIFSGITLGPHVNQLVIGTPSLADLNMMMQSCHHYWEVKNLQQCTWLWATPSISRQLDNTQLGCTYTEIQVQQMIRKMQVRGICRPTRKAMRTLCDTPRSMDSRDLSMRCLSDQQHWLNITGPKQNH